MVSQGPVGEIMVVIENHYLEGTLGDSIKNLLATSYQGIPEMFGEAYFKMENMPPQMFKGYAKRHRSILQIIIAENAKNVLRKQEDPFAYGQRYMRVEAKNKEAAMQVISKHKQQILDYFEQGEIAHFTKLYADEKSNFSTEVNNVFRFWIAAPEYSIKRKETDFLWASRETKRTSQAVMVYEFPYTSEAQLSKDSLIAKRDEVLKKYVNGLKAGTYMRTEKKLAPVLYKVIDVNGYYGVELRGYWTLEGDFMGGPFLLFAVVDEPNERIIVLDSYVFAPEAKYSRVKFIREIEGIFRTLRITPKEE